MKGVPVYKGEGDPSLPDYYERTRLDGSEDTGQRLQDFDDGFYENNGFTAVF